MYGANDLDPCKHGLASYARDALDNIQKTAFIENFKCHEIE